MRRQFLRIMVALTLAGCSSSGEKLDQSRINEIQKGLTTRAEVEAKLGPPDRVAMIPDGRRALYYMHSEANMKATNFIPGVNFFAGGMNTRRQELQILLNKNDVVEDYEFTDRTGDMGSGPFGHSSETATPEGSR